MYWLRLLDIFILRTSDRLLGTPRTGADPRGLLPDPGRQRGGPRVDHRVYAAVRARQEALAEHSSSCESNKNLRCIYFSLYIG